MEDTPPASENNNPFPFKINLIQNEKELDCLAGKILNDSSNPVIGVDCEAALEMSRFGILCLIQISYLDEVYIIDVTKIELTKTKLGALFGEKRILKVFHDVTEDCSILYHKHKIKCDGIFDTQVAHRQIFEAQNWNQDYLEKNRPDFADAKKHYNISLNGLIKWYLDIDNIVKDEVKPLMHKDIYFWLKRPFTEQMISYAANDVIYLPKIFIQMTEILKGLSQLTLSDVLDSCNGYLQYPELNKQITQKTRDLQENTQIQGLIKNFLPTCIYVGLNIGINGTITNKSSINFINKIHKFGDILQFSIKNFDSLKKCYILDFIKKEKQTPLSYNSTQYFPSSQYNIGVSQYGNSQFYMQSQVTIQGHEYYATFPQHPQVYVSPKTPTNHPTYQNNNNFYTGYKYVIPVQYSPMNYLMSDSIYVQPTLDINLSNVSSPINTGKKSNSVTSKGTKLNIQNSTKFKIPSSETKADSITEV